MFGKVREMAQKKQKNSKSSAMPTSDKLGVFGLAAIVVSSMIGGGIFSLPQNMAQSASAGACFFVWVFTVFVIGFFVK